MREEATYSRLKAYGERVAELIGEFHGRVVGSAGDSVLAEFASPVAAVECALRIQREIAERNRGLAETEAMEFRIGINLGDVIDDGASLYGDGVNVAARLEGLAEPGGVTISGAVHDQVRNKIDAVFAGAGARRLKNIPDRVRIYNVLAQEEAAAHRARIKRQRFALAATAGVLGAAALALLAILAAPYLAPVAPPPPAAELPRLRDCTDCPELAAIPAGSYLRGSSSEQAGHDPSEGPVSRVEFARGFALGRYEVTFAQWDLCVAEGGCTSTPIDRGWGRGTRPVIYVSWTDVNEYLAWLGARTGKRYRLPSEAEWEYAARAGAATAFPWGDAMLPERANCQDCRPAGSDQTFPVGSFPPNAFGLYDVVGNVWEWVADCWNGSYAGAPADGAPWLIGECGKRVVRGGAWGLPASDLRLARRVGDQTDLRSGRRGFRVARDLD